MNSQKPPPMADNQQHIADSQRPGGVVVIPPVNNWISVNDRLPYKDGNSSIYVLVNDTYNGIVVRPYNEYQGCWDDEGGDDYYCDAVGGNITHWMELPDPPQI